MRRLAIVLLLGGSSGLTGCIAAIAPIVAAGAMGKKVIDKKRDDDLPSSARPEATPTPVALTTATTAPPPGGGPAADAIPTAGPVLPPPGSVPPGMQYLYGSGEAAAISVQAYLGLTEFLVARATDFSVGHPVSSVVLAPGATLDNPKFLTCGPKQRPAVVLDIDETALMNLGYEADDSQRSGAYDQQRWDRWETSGIGAVDPVPGALEAIRSARAAGVEVVFNSNRSKSNAASTVSALTLAGLGPVTHLQNLWLKGDDAVGGSGKDARRLAISARYCVIAMVGDQLGDFSDLFNVAGMTPAQRRAMTGSPRLRMLWGHGWFVLPNPVYGSALKGGVDDVFPKDRRWSDPGATIAGGAPAPAPAPVTAPALGPPPSALTGTSGPVAPPPAPPVTAKPVAAPVPAIPQPYGPALPPEKK